MVRPRRLAVIALFAILAVSAFGFAASNTVPQSRAGDGSGDIAGFTVENIHYNINASDPALLSSVQFTLNPPLAVGGSVYATVDGTNWISCSATTPHTCPTTVTVLSAEDLRVVAAN